MRRPAILSLAAILAATALPPAAMAQPSTLATCVADHTTGRDRKDLARWIFAVMAVHPAIADLSAATPASRDAANDVIGTLMTRLLAVDCREETLAIAQSGNSAAAFEDAFKPLGELAMQELMSDPQVQASIRDLPRHLDMAKLAEAFKKK